MPLGGTLGAPVRHPNSMRERAIPQKMKDFVVTFTPPPTG